MKSGFGGFLAVGVLSGSLFGVSAARADGGFPRAHDIFLEPGNSDHILVRSDYWGLFRSTDAGKTWQYGCSELFGGSSKYVARRNVLYLAGGRILVSTFTGIRMTDDFCNWRDNSSMASQPVEDFAVSGTNLYAVTALGTDGGVSSNLFRSTDNGDTWTNLSTKFPPNFIASSIRIAPSDPTRVYVGGSTVGKTDAIIQVSSDSGATWQEHSFPSPAQVATIRARAVSPINPDIAIVWVDNGGTDDTQPDWMFATGDGGVTWTQIYAGQQDLPGLVFSPDGTELRISGKMDSLMGAKVTDVLSTQQAAFQKVFDGQVWGLTWTADGTLYAGNNNFTARGIPAFTLGKSTDGGTTFDPLMSICSLEFATCDASSSIEAMCHAPYDGTGGIVVDFLQTSRCTPPPAPASSAKKSSDGCSYATAPKDSDSPFHPAALVAVAALALGARARRRRR